MAGPSVKTRSLATLTRKNAASVTIPFAEDLAGIYIKPAMTIHGHYSPDTESKNALHSGDLANGLAGYTENKADLLIEELFELAMRGHPDAKGGRDIVVRLPVTADAAFITVVIQTKDAEDDAFKNNLRPVFENFINIRTDWELRHKN